MYITAKDLPALIQGLDDYNVRIGPCINYTLTDSETIDIEPSTKLCDLEKYLAYCVSFGHYITIGQDDMFHIDIDN